MKNTPFRAGSLLMILALVSGFILTSCKGKDEQPDLPPASSMKMDFSSFGGSSGKTADSTGNWGYSAVNVGVWNVVLYLNLVVPTGAFAESFNHDPKWDRKDEHWIWAYDFNWLAHYNAQLHGWIEGDHVNWEMHISQTGGFQDVIWFSGTSALDNSNGSWVLNKDGNDPKSYISMNWTKVSDTEMDITFTNILSGDPGQGDYIHAGHTTADPRWDRFYTIYHTSDSHTTEIEWHHLNQNGRVKDSVWFGDSNWHCWDELHVDAVCL